jgi:hypothetical protein
MLKEHDKFTGFYEIEFANDCLVSKDGKFIYADTGNSIKTWRDKHLKAFKTVLRHNGEYVHTTVHQVLAEVFVPVPDELKKEDRKRLIVCFLDDDKKNLDIANLYWKNYAKFQQDCFLKRQQQTLDDIGFPFFNSFQTGLYPNAIECNLKPGFYFIPFTRSPIVIDKKGNCFNLKTNRPHRVRTDRKGYALTNLYISELKRHNGFKIHRIVAMLFVGKPERHFDIPFKDLQVNHMDCVKLNNDYANLEWVINSENVQHAREHDLFTNVVGTLAMDIRTAKITKFKSVSECARHFNVRVSTLHYHLKSNSVGRITKKWHVFKLDNETSWPKLLVYECGENTHRWTCNVLTVHAITDEKILFVDIASACTALGLNINIVKNQLSRKGNDVLFDNWKFIISNDVGFEE